MRERKGEALHLPGCVAASVDEDEEALLRLGSVLSDELASRCRLSRCLSASSCAVRHTSQLLPTRL